MIELQKTIVGDEQFTTITGIEPDGRYCGIPVYYVDISIEKYALPQLERLGLRKVKEEPWKWTVLYAQKYPAIIARVIFKIMSMYWKIIRWLYFNARLFQPIPVNAMFSWKYFTPYTWARRLRDRT